MEILLLGQHGQLLLAVAGAVLGHHAQLEVLLRRVGDDLAEQLRKFGGMLRLFPSGLLVVHADLGIALSVRDSRHRQIHTDLGAFAGEVHPQAHVAGHADHMLGGPHLFALGLHKLGAGSLALGAEFGRRIALMYITANRTYIFHRFHRPF